MRYNEESCALELSAEELCAYALPSGDLGAQIKDRGRPDGEGYKLLQTEADGYYDPSVSLSCTAELGGIYYTVSGNPCGIIRRADGEVTVDEVRLVGAYEFYSAPSPISLARMRCYAYMLCIRDGMESVKCRLTYFDPEKKKTKYFKYRLLFSDLKEYFKGLLLKIEWRARLEYLRVTEELPSASAARFPYPQLREGQEIMIRESYSAVRRGKRVFLEAPTGTGKTVSSLYPAVRALGDGHIDRIFYLTAKASTRREAYLAAGKLFEVGVKLRTVVITAKEQMCPMRGINSLCGGGSTCDSNSCPYAKGYYDRSCEALKELIREHNGYPRGLILAVAEKYKVCPYELSLDLSELCHIIICDYNYAFDPAVYFRRYFAPEGERGAYAFLIDEAHNLADRARDMYSADIRLSDFKALDDETLGLPEELLCAARDAAAATDKMKRLCREDMTKDSDGREMGFYMSHQPFGGYNDSLELFRKKCDGWLKKNKEHPAADRVRMLSSAVRRYLCVNEYFDKGTLCYVQVMGGDVTVKTFCLDPSATMNTLLGRAKGAVLFSATLTPTEYFCDMLGSSDSGESVSLPSPFDPENLCVAALDGLSARSEDRKKNYNRYATIIAATVSPKHGNYIAYFPSYECLEGVLAAFKRKYPRVETVVQSRGMDASEKEKFLSAFLEDEGHLRVGFCVLGGAFSEGVDLPGSRLIGSVIFGVGIPALSNERNIIKEYFDNNIGMGYEYAYTYPGMNRVLQAVGRVIRREGDKGVAVLVDDRYSEPKYRALFPAHWKGVQYTAEPRSLAEIIRRFWKNHDDCE